MEVMEWIMVNREEYLLKLTFTWKKKNRSLSMLSKKNFVGPEKAHIYK